MALRKTHVAVSEALVLGGLAITKQPVAVDLVTVLGVWIGVQLPDIDIRNTRINRSLGIAGWLFTLQKHRTWTHSIWAILLLGFLAICLPVLRGLNANFANLNFQRVFYWAVFTGYFLHLVEDSFSRQGVRWLYPIESEPHQPSRRTGRRNAKWYLYKTGGPAEAWFYSLALLAVICLTMLIFYDHYLIK